MTNENETECKTCMFLLERCVIDSRQSRHNICYRYEPNGIRVGVGECELLFTKYIRSKWLKETEQ